MTYILSPYFTRNKRVNYRDSNEVVFPVNKIEFSLTFLGDDAGNRINQLIDELYFERVGYMWGIL